MDVKRGKLDSMLGISKFQSIFKSKKGQVTIFIIVGIIILFVSAGVILISKEVVRDDIISESEPAVASVPQAFQPIQVFTDNCLGQVVKEAVILIGERGGYLSPPGKYNEKNPTDSDGLMLGGLKVPYWLYNSAPNIANQIQFSTLKPKLHDEEDGKQSIESQLANYVKQKIDSCLNGYKSFETQGFKIQLLKER